MNNAFDRNLEAEYELTNELIDNFDFEGIPAVVDAIAELPNYQNMKKVESLHDVKQMRRHCRELIKIALDNLLETYVRYKYDDEDGEHEILESSVSGQFDVILSYDTLTKKYSGVLKYVAFRSDFGL